MAILKFQNVLNKFLLLVIGVTVSGCGGSVDKQRYKVTMTVEVAGKEYSGSSVQEFIHRKCAPNTGPICADHHSVVGEAVAVDVGGRGYLFILMNGQQYYQSITGMSNLLEADKFMKKQKSWELDLSNIPTIVTFTDINEPKSVKRVLLENNTHQIPTSEFGKNGQQIIRNELETPNFHQLFGKDAHFKTIKVERTTKNISFGNVEQIIPWIKINREIFASDDPQYYGKDTFYSSLSSIYFVNSGSGDN